MMLIVTVGYTLGRVSWRGVSFGPAGGTILVGGLAGALGFDVGSSVFTQEGTVSLGALGFALFIYSVGFDAGPRFFGAFRSGRAWRFVAVGLLVNVLAVLCAVAIAPLFGLGADLVAGTLAGGISSAPTYAASVEAVLDAHREIGTVTIAFAASYPVGLVALVILAQFLPRARGVDLADDAERMALPDGAEGDGTEQTRAFEVRRDEICDRPLQELDVTGRTGCWITRLLHGHDVVAVRADTRLARGDHVLARGSVVALQAFEKLFGPEVEDQVLRERMPAPRRIAVLARGAVGQPLRDLALPSRTGTLVVGVDRGGVHLEPAADFVLQRGDVVEVIGRRSATRHAAAVLGRLERPTHETDIAVYAGGIFLGLLLGRLRIHAFGIDVAVGIAGGLLIAGVLLGRFHRIGPFTTHVPRAARQLVRDLGILLFIAEAGTIAGHELGVVDPATLLPVIAAGVVIAVFPVLLSLVAACRLLGLSPVEAWGSVSGGMTSSGALNTLQRITGGSEVAIAYAAAYAPATVLATIAGRVVVLALG